MIPAIAARTDGQDSRVLQVDVPDDCALSRLGGVVCVGRRRLLGTR